MPRQARLASGAFLSTLSNSLADNTEDGMYFPKVSASKAVTVTGVSAPFPDMVKTFDGTYLFVCNTNCWINQSATAGAAVAVAGANNNMYVPANTPIMVHAREGISLAVIQDSAGGKASLTISKGL